MEFTRQVIEANPNPIYVKDRHGRIILANTSFANLHKSDLSNLLETGKLENDYSFERDLEVLQTDQPISFEESYKVNRGHKIWYQTLKKTFTLENGSRYLISISSDITTSKRYQQVADELEEKQGDFLIGIRHKVRASVNAIMGMGKQMKKNYLTNSQEEYLNTILSIAGSLVELPGGLYPGKTESKEAKTNKDINLQPFLTKPLKQDEDYSNLAGIRLLLIGHNQVNTAFVSSFLQSWGATLDIATQGEAALEQVRSKVYDLIMLDVEMQEVDGLELTYQIKYLLNANQATPIIALLPSKDNRDRQELNYAGFADFMFTPYSETDLYNIISKHTDGTEDEEAPAPTPHHQPWKKSVLYDFSGLGYLMDDPVFVRKMQHLFISTVPQQLEKLTDAIQAQDWRSAVHLAHRLKSIYGNIKVNEAAAALKVIEDNASKEVCHDDNQQMLQVLHNLTHAIVEDFSGQLQANA